MSEKTIANSHLEPIRDYLARGGNITPEDDADAEVDAEKIMTVIHCIKILRKIVEHPSSTPIDNSWYWAGLLVATFLPELPPATSLHIDEGRPPDDPWKGPRELVSAAWDAFVSSGKMDEEFKHLKKKKKAWMDSKMQEKVQILAMESDDDIECVVEKAKKLLSKEFDESTGSAVSAAGSSSESSDEDGGNKGQKGKGVQGVQGVKEDSSVAGIATSVAELNIDCESQSTTPKA
ncbi:hypothetical protein DFH27DRAFT_623406 [Peziza echinospora]|nr:hypothetical protein DFH27DRAFT_623406 [Peziza echinospora]